MVVPRAVLIGTSQRRDMDRRGVRGYHSTGETVRATLFRSGLALQSWPPVLSDMDGTSVVLWTTLHTVRHRSCAKRAHSARALGQPCSIVRTLQTIANPVQREVVTKDMAKVMGKLPVTIPKRLAERYSITPGASVLFQEAGDVIRVIPMATQAPSELDRSQGLALCDAARQGQRGREARVGLDPVHGRGCTREELYRRGSID